MDVQKHVLLNLPAVLFQDVYKRQRLNRNDGELLKKIICIDGKTMCANKRKEILALFQKPDAMAGHMLIVILRCLLRHGFLQSSSYIL